MSRIISKLGQFIYPVRIRLLKLFRTRFVEQQTPHRMPLKSIYDLSFQGIDGNEISLASFKGRKMLLVNTASECGFTPQYATLQKLHEKYGDRLSVIGFPANNFDAQEPGTDSEILNFCQRNYGVTFQLSKKIDVVGPGKHPIFEWLTNKELNGWNDRDPNWNFCKYLVSENGTLLKFFSHRLDPMDEQITSQIASG